MEPAPEQLSEHAPDTTGVVSDGPEREEAADFGTESYAVPVRNGSPAQSKPGPDVDTESYMVPVRVGSTSAFQGPGAAAAGTSGLDNVPEQETGGGLASLPGNHTPAKPVTDLNDVVKAGVLDQVPLDRPPDDPKQPPPRLISRRRIIGIAILGIGVLAALILGFRIELSKSKAQEARFSSPSAQLKTQQLPTESLSQQLGAAPTTNTVTVNGRLNVSNAIVLQPSVQTGPAVIGQMYYDQATNTLAYYNGSAAVHLQGGGNVTNNITNVTNNTFKSFITNAAGSGQSINGTPGTLAMFAAGGASLGDSAISQNGAAVTVSGTAKFKSGSNSTAAFQVQNANGAGLLAADTLNNTVVLGNDGAPENVTLRGGAGAGSNISGATLTIAASSGTGSATSGDIIFETGVSAENGIEFDAAAAVGGGFGGNTITENVTVGGQGNRILLASDDCGAATMNYDGRPMTRAGFQNGGGGVGSAAYIEMWYLVAPPSGTHSLVATFADQSAFQGCQGSGGGTLGAASYYNVDQTDPIASENSVTGGANISQFTSSLNVTTTSPSQVVVDAIATNLDVGTPTGCTSFVNAGQTSRWTDGHFKYVCGSDQAATGSGMTISYNLSATDWSDIAVVLNPVVAQSSPLFLASATTPDAMYDRLDITAGGNIGIDNSTPQYALDVGGTVNASTSVYTPVLDTQTPGTLTIGQFDATNIQLGGANTGTITLGTGGGTPVVPAIQGAAAVGNNIIGANMIFDAANGTGVGGSGDIIFNTAMGVSDPQVTLDATSDDEEPAASNNAPLTWVHTTGASSDRVLIVSVGFEAPTTPVSVPQGTATSVTYDGTPLTELTSVIPTLGEASGSVWYLVNPPSGSHNVSVTFTGTASNNDAEATTFYNVDQTTPIANFVGNNTPQGSTISTSLIGTNPGQLIFDSLMTRPDLSQVTPGSGQTMVYNLGPSGMAAKGSTKQGQSSSTTMSWSGQGGSTLVDILMALNPEPNVTPDTLTEAARFTQSGTLGLDLSAGENAQSTITFGGSADRSIGVNQNPGTGSGHSLTIAAGEGAVGSNDGGNLVLQGGQATGSGISGAVSILTGNTASTSGSITLQTGGSSTTSAGNLSLDTGSSTVDGTVVETDGFEDGADDFGAWTGDNTTAAQDCTKGRTGSCSLSVSSDNGGAALEHGGDWGTVVTPGHNYVFSVYVKADGADNLSDVSDIYGEVIWGTPSGWQYDDSALAQATTTGWTHIQWTGIAPAGAQYISFVLGGPNNGATVYFDDVTATDLSSSATTALVSLGATNAQAVTLGNLTELGATSIYGSSNINLNSGVSNINLLGGQVIAKAETDNVGTFQIQNGFGDVLLSADTAGMIININGSLAVTGDITVDGHIVTGGDTPGIAAGAAACTTPTIGVAGDDTSGTVTITTGTGCSGGGTLATLTFASAFANPPNITLTPANAAASTLQYYNGNSDANTFTVDTNNAPANTTTYKWHYWVAQ